MIHSLKEPTKPDAEDLFANAPERAFRIAAGIPFALTGAVVLHYLVRGRCLPGRLPSRWALTGEPRTWVSKRTAAWTDILVATTASGIAATALRPGRQSGERARRLAVAALLGGIAAGFAVTRPAVRGGWWVQPLRGVSMLGCASAPLFGLALAGRRRQQGRAPDAAV